MYCTLSRLQINKMMKERNKKKERKKERKKEGNSYELKDDNDTCANRLLINNWRKYMSCKMNRGCHKLSFTFIGGQTEAI